MKNIQKNFQHLKKLFIDLNLKNYLIMLRTFKFQREIDGRWYVVLPEWTGSKEDLEMVMGANTMLDIIAQGESDVDVTISEEEFDNHTFVLKFVGEASDGGDYELTSTDGLYEFDVWLCKVVKFVYGSIPKKLYVK